MVIQSTPKTMVRYGCKTKMVFAFIFDTAEFNRQWYEKLSAEDSQYFWDEYKMLVNVDEYDAWNEPKGFKKHEIILPDVFEKKYYHFEEIGADKAFVKCVHWYDNTYWIVEWHTPPQQMSGQFWTMNDGGDKSSDDLSELEEWLYTAYES